METSAICEKCNIMTSVTHIFSCNHSLCSKCILRNIVFTHLKALACLDSFQITCPCTSGTKNFTTSDIPQLLTLSSEPSTCVKHRATAKLYCVRCELWLCDDCREIHNLISAHHQLNPCGINFRKCNRHQEQSKDLYCKDCHEFICLLCTLQKDSKHSTHNYALITDYADELKKAVPNVNFSAQFEKMRRDFLGQVDCAMERTMKLMDQLIQVIEDSKKIYKENMEQLLQKAEVVLKLCQFYYLDFGSNSKSTLDIHLLEDYMTLNMKFPMLELQDVTNKKLRKIHQDFEDCLKIQPAEAINADWIQIYSRKNTHTLTGHNLAVTSLLALKDGRIVSGSGDMTIIVWEVNEKGFRSALTLTGHTDSIISLIQLSDGRMASGSRDYTIKIWKMEEKEFRNTMTLTGHNKFVSSLLQLNNGRLASGSGDCTIKIWQVKEKEFTNTLTFIGHNAAVFSLIQLEDERLASGSADFTIKIWEVTEKDFKNTLTLSGHNNSVFSLIQLKDRQIASGSADKTIKVWEVEKKEFKNILTLIGHNDCIYSLILMKDGRISSGSDDETIKVWEIKDNHIKSCLTLFGHSGTIRSIIQLQDGRILSGSHDKTIKVWG